ncbi:hypothetical protein SNE40_007270 [Patella caerulea]|uniref:MICOS complex subunit MIC13 n=1 Tax=Patella caerulea TaxID=87958 RepID=A0AAN8PX94_PATCE
MAATVVKVATKVAVGVGAVYVTVDQGVWGTNSQAVKAVDKVRSSVLPAANDYVKSIPSLNDINNSVLRTWNSGVKMTFSMVSNAPSKAGEYSKKAYDSSLSLIKEN